ncbi:MAG: nickel-dependent hydrogenase large subunit [Sedimentisphaerales bacterium]|nr:nickel-dependent hydrogenase large subunit [Sedimentisphaerales bacterium]
MPKTIVIDPVTRLEGHLRAEVTVDAVNGENQVVDAKVSGTLFRGIEQMLIGRDPWEAAQLTQRICGVCPVPHGVVAAMALEKAAGSIIPDNARILRNLIMGANFIQSHILHFYHLALLDFIKGPPMSPWQPQWETEYRINDADSARLNKRYIEAIKAFRQVNEMTAIFSGRQPHAPALAPGGFTTVPTNDKIDLFRRYSQTVIDFVKNTYLPDVEFVATQYPEYNQIGKGYGNLIAFGAFDLNGAGGKSFFHGGRIVQGNGQVQPMNNDAINEHVASSWYENSTSKSHPVTSATQPVYPKDGAYSWIKAPRYENQAYETGPLARMTINGLYKQGVSVHDRHKARALETLKLAEALPVWLDELNVGSPVYSSYTAPTEAAGFALAEAPRGALGHWIGIAGGKIAHYQVLTPTCWNASPQDDDRQPGPMEKALLGAPVQDTDNPIEVLRVIHSFDPCLGCAVHVCRITRR